METTQLGFQTLGNSAWIRLESNGKIIVVFELQL